MFFFFFCFFVFVFFLRQLKKLGVNNYKFILIRFYRTIVESILSFSITVRYGSAKQKDKTRLDRVVNSAAKTIGAELPSVASLYSSCTVRKSQPRVQSETLPTQPTSSSAFALWQTLLRPQVKTKPRQRQQLFICRQLCPLMRSFFSPPPPPPRC